jgi:hypothetical protein
MEHKLLPLIFVHARVFRPRLHVQHMQERGDCITWGHLLGLCVIGRIYLFENGNQRSEPLFQTSVLVFT